MAAVNYTRYLQSRLALALSSDGMRGECPPCCLEFLLQIIVVWSWISVSFSEFICTSGLSFTEVLCHHTPS